VTTPKNQPEKFFRVRYAPGPDGTPEREVLDPDLDDTAYGHLYDDRRTRLFQEHLEKLRAGTCTVVTLYKAVLDMTDREMGQRTGLGVRAVRRHQTVEGFRRARVSDLEAYARVFGVPLHALFLFPARGTRPVEADLAPGGLAAVRRPSGEAP